MNWILFSFSLANAETLTVDSVDASSYFSEKNDVYSPKNIKAGKVSKPWVEDENGSGLGSWIQLNFDGANEVSEVRLWNGNWYSYNEWDYYNRASRVEISFSDGSSERIELQNKKEVAVIKLKKKVKTSFVKVTVKGVHQGSTYGDRTAISEIQVLNSGPEKFAWADSLTASSTLPEDNDGTYETSNLQDILDDTAWCTGDSGDAAVLKFNFNGPKKIKKLRLVNGNAASPKIFFAFSRAKKATLSFDDGSTHQVNIKPSLREQVFSLPGTRTGSVEMRIDEVIKGKSATAKLCLSEARFE